MPEKHAIRLTWTASFLTCAMISSAQEHAESMVRRFQQEVESGLSQRGERRKFDLYQAYNNGRLDGSDGTNTWSDKTGNCRLEWVDKRLRNQLETPVLAERFTRELHDAVRDPGWGIAPAVRIAAETLGVTPEAAAEQSNAGEAPDSCGRLRNALRRAQEAFAASLAPLTEEQIEFLRRRLVDVTTTQIQGQAARFPDADSGRQVCDLLETLHRPSLVKAGVEMAALADPAFISGLSELIPEKNLENGILIGSPTNDVYVLDEMNEVRALIDVGGDDTYIEGTLSSNRTVLVIIDLGGDDTYRGEKPGIQGGAVLGVSMIVDVAGDDSYEAADVAQGACLAGIGILIDVAGNDT